MKKSCLSLFLLLCVSAGTQAQVTPPAPKKLRPTGHSQLISLVTYLPIGVFARSHIAGAGLEYAWSHRRFGQDASAAKLFGLTFNAGGDYYFGKKIRTAAYPFRYDGYIYVHAAGGIIYNPWANAQMMFTAGPSYGIYKGNGTMGISAAITGNYFISPRLALGFGAVYKKHSGDDELWAGAVRVGWRLKGKF